ncbi:MAG: ABC transporter substrate-binding protein [Candidatus Ancillula sp.]|jgi:ABC-type nitrate/sulfonate/bicarbonate transport system substrate-binding protein|nr:ABC transporter substrate-binding protein [Candidatus Ancillula sp.]
MKKSLGILISLVLVVASNVVFTACGKKTSSGNLEKLTVVLDWTPNTNHSGIYVALDKGYYSDAGLDVQLQQPPEDGATAIVGSGQAQIGIDYQEYLAHAIINGAPVTAVGAIMAHNTSCLLSLKSKNIERPRDLEGKKFAYDGTDAALAEYKYMVKQDGGDPDKVQWINMMVENVVAALKADVDVVSGIYYGWEGLQAQLAGLDVNVMFTRASDELDFYSPIFIANNDYINLHKDVVKRFMQATKHGYEDAANNAQEAANILVKHVPELDGKLVHKSQDYLSHKYIDDAHSWGIFDLSRWNKSYDWMFYSGLLPKKLPENTGVTNEFVS